MITKNEIKRVKSLRNKKHRKELQLFVAEGEKVVLSLLNAGWQVERIYTLNTLGYPTEVIVTSKIMEQITLLKSPSNMLGVFHIPTRELNNTLGFTVALDNIQDPGNLGTIIRLCDWFGVSNLVCSKDTVDCYNPKVVQASMGSLAKVQCTYTDLLPFLESCRKPIFGTLLEGESIYKTKIEEDSILVMGNESTGISTEVKKMLQHTITIPRVGKSMVAESLNVATATAIVLSQIFKP